MSESKDTTPDFIVTQPLITSEDDRKAKRKAWYEANKKTVNAKKRASYDKDKKKAYDDANKDNRKDWYEANKDRILIQQKAYRDANKDKKKAYREANKDRESTRGKAYRDANKERIKTKKKAYRDANEDKVTLIQRKSKLSSKYGMTVSEFNDMVGRCNGRCPCCKTAFSAILGERPCVDHDHRTGAVRGILCRQCNILIGHANDQSSILLACARYLKRTAQIGDDAAQQGA